MGRLQDKVAIITGGTGGIGLAAAELFAAEGARVVLVDLDQTALDAAVAKIGADRAMAVTADVSDADQSAAYVRATLERHGRIDVLFANAGIEGVIESVADYPIDVFDKVMAVNVRGVWLGLRNVLPEMAGRGSGSVVITSSVAGLRGSRKLSAYVASKHAVVGLMKVAALEYASAGVRVNAINPSPIATRMIDSLEEGYAPGQREMMKQKLERAVPLRRYGEPVEVARLALFLASDDASYITGNCYPVDGGMAAA